jgi:hypothetical protein
LQFTFMPRLDPAEVGYTAEGWSLGMPTRPKWQVRHDSKCTSTLLRMVLNAHTLTKI